MFRRLTLPAQEDAWERLQESLEIIRDLNTRRVVRHTLVKGWNLGWVDAYAEMDLTARPDFIEPKGYVYMGKSRQRLGKSHVPTHEEIGHFARQLAHRTGYQLLDESPDSKVYLLGESAEGRYLPGLGPSGELPMVA